MRSIGRRIGKAPRVVVAALLVLAVALPASAASSTDRETAHEMRRETAHEMRTGRRHIQRHTHLGWQAHSVQHQPRTLEEILLHKGPH